MPMFTVTYATHPIWKGERALLADIYLPDTTAKADLLVWLHSGGFRTGSRTHRNHARIAAEFAKHGYACAFIDYRLARPPAVLSRRTKKYLPALVTDAQNAGETMPESYFGPRALAVVEDCCAFLMHAVVNHLNWGLTGRFLLGGSSVGAVSALNVLYLPHHLSLKRPPIATVLAYSGGFAYPSFLWPTGARILAQSSPSDDHIPISSIRRLKWSLHDLQGDICLQIENDAQPHDDIRLFPQERLSAAVQRAVLFDRSPDPLSLSVNISGTQVMR